MVEVFLVQHVLAFFFAALSACGYILIFAPHTTSVAKKELFSFLSTKDKDERQRISWRSYLYIFLYRDDEFLEMERG